MEADPQVLKAARRIKRIRIATLIFGVALLVCSGLLIGIGFKDLADTVDNAANNIEVSYGDLILQCCLWSCMSSSPVVILLCNYFVFAQNPLLTLAHLSNFAWHF